MKVAMEGHKQLVLFPFLAQGHIIPFLNLAKHLDQHNKKHNKHISITLVSTPLNIAKIRSSLSEDYSSINLAELPFSSSKETTESLPLEQYTPFFESTETSLRAPFERLIGTLMEQGGNKEICIIADYFLGWTVETAEKFEVHHAVFVTGGPYGMSVMFSLNLNPPSPSFLSGASPSDEFSLVNYPDVRVPFFTLINILAVLPDGEEHPIVVFTRRQLIHSFRSSAILLNTIEELDKEGMDLFRRYPSLPLWPIGPLVGSLSYDSKGKHCIDFLDSKSPNSVIFISFGSNNSISASEMIDLAKGLQASRKPFIWVIRTPVDFEGSTEGEFKNDWLPEGFEKSIKENSQGLLVHHWAPQLQILSHVSTGAFLSHCGWNSVLESLYQGVPIIGWPLLADQLYNSSMLEQMGAGIEISRGRIFGGLEKGGWKKVKGAVEMVLSEEKGNEMRKKAGEIRELMKMAIKDDFEFKGSSCKAIDGFLQATFDGQLG